MQSWIVIVVVGVVRLLC